MVKLMLVLCFTLVAFSSLGQDPLFSQFYNAPTYYNPGMVGLSPGFRARLSMRDQWPQLPGEFRNYMFSIDFAERNIPGSGGIGLIAMNENAGTGYFKTQMVGLQSAVRIPLSRNVVSQVGFTTAFVQKSINWNNLVFTDQLDPIYGNIYETSFIAPDAQNIIYPDFSLGGALRFTESGGNFNAIMGTLGFAVHHLFTPNESFLSLESPLPVKFSVTGDLVLEMDGSRGLHYRRGDNTNPFKFNPGFIYESQDEFRTIAVGMNILKSSIYGGVWYRNRSTEMVKMNDLIFLLGLNVPFSNETRVKINYSYDFVVSGLQGGTGGSHEITLMFELDEFAIFSSRLFGPTPRGYRSKSEIECTPF